MNSLIIGIAGKAGTGKSTLARVLSVAYCAHTTAFADALKAGAYRIYGASGWFPQKEPYIRKWLQSRGEEGRAQEGNLWLQVWESLYGYLPAVIIGDVRYPNEVQFIQEKGGIVLYLDDGTDSQDEHPSENLDYTLCNFLIEGDSKRAIHRKALVELARWKRFSPTSISVLNDNPGFPIHSRDVTFPTYILNVNNWKDFLETAPVADVFACSKPYLSNRAFMFEREAKPFDGIVINTDEPEVFWEKVAYYFHPEILYDERTL